MLFSIDFDKQFDIIGMHGMGMYQNISKSLREPKKQT